jgi:hypothetical protein
MGGDKMSVRPFRLRALSVVLSGLVLSACVPFDLGGLRPELAQPLALAQAFYLRGDKHDAQHSVFVAETVPNQTAAEKNHGGQIGALGRKPDPGRQFRRSDCARADHVFLSAPWARHGILVMQSQAPTL